ncbi:nitroreductase family protein [Mannheimia indoligenes]|uniref:nitroreductase family protein n=1 Tax=Mannheimia indoligenes TaxID=3103145 RepID=UPI002FE61BD4
MTEQEIKQILADAQNAPSACNTQPWLVHVASGETLERLKKRFQVTFAQGITKLILNLTKVNTKATTNHVGVISIPTFSPPVTGLPVKIKPVAKWFMTTISSATVHHIWHFCLCRRLTDTM